MLTLYQSANNVMMRLKILNQIIQNLAKVTNVLNISYPP